MPTLAQSIPPEGDLLRCCARARVDAATAERVRTLVAQPLRWEYVLELATWHRVRPLLYRNLQDHAAEAVPADALDTLRRFFNWNATGNLQKSAALLKILKAFDEKEIALIPQKGPVLATTAFGDVGLREFVDLDLVVQPPDVPRAMEALIDLGYEPASGTPPDFVLPPAKSQFGLRHGQHGVEVELHWKLLEDRLAYHLDIEAMWARLGEARVHGKVVPSLSDEDLVLVLCTHGIKHYWMRMHWLCCVSELLRVYEDLDWEILFERTRQAGAVRTFSLGLFLAHTLLDAPLPDAVQDRIAINPALRPLASQIMEWIFFPPGEMPAEPMPPGALDRAWFNLRVRERLPDGARYSLFRLKKFATPTEQDRALIPLPDGLSFLYYPLRLFRAAGVAGLRGLKNLGSQ